MGCEIAPLGDAQSASFDAWGAAFRGHLARIGLRRVRWSES